MKGYVQATVATRHDVTDDLAVFTLDWGAEGVAPYAPGQYVTLALERDGRTVKRAYSIVSAPHEPLMELHIEHVEDGRMTPGLFDLQPGDAVWARRKIVGHFMQEATKRAHVMMATVTGAAPFISMIRAQQHALMTGALDEPATSRFLLLHGASDPAELEPYTTELADLANAAPWLTYVPCISRPWNHPAWSGERGRVGDVLRKHLDAWTSTHGLDVADVVGYACGNPQMIEHAKGVLKRTGLSPDAIREEKYYTEAAPTQPTALAPGPVFEAAQAARRAKPVPTAPPGKRPPGVGALRSVKPGSVGGPPPRKPGAR
ncbi:MAG: FAD-binding oxidoreductase [Bacteroidota bacterium]